MNAARRTITRMIGLTAAALVLLAPHASAQDAAAATARLNAMRKFDLWAGEWRGSGWSLDATGQRLNFTLSESVKKRVGGAVLLVEGRGVTTAAGGAERVTHDGIVLVSYDEKTGRYRWQGHDAARDAVNADIIFVDGGFQWAIKADERGTLLRFTLKIDDRNWNELGELSPDGTTWIKFMEMTLARQ